MSLIRCPECGTRISDTAKTCPYCGYESKNDLLPISQQDKYHPIPVLQSSGEKWEIIPISNEDNNTIIQFLSKYENLRVIAPGLADAISALFSKETHLIADIDPLTQSLIDNGDLIFTLDKQGGILPTLRNADSKKIFELIRLKEFANYPELNNTINNLSNQVALAQIMDELRFIEEKMTNIQKELQEDRLAMADSAWDKMLQSRGIEDNRLRTIAIQNAINSATDAKRVLMRNFVVSLDASIKTKKPKEAGIKASDAAKDLAALTNCVHIEIDGYVFLGENNASVECLKEFLSFIKNNKLDDRNTLLLLNENLPEGSKIASLAEDFQNVVNKIELFVNSNSSTQGLLED